MASGKTTRLRLVDGGIDAKEGRLMRVWVRSLQFAPAGHAIEHPRQHDEPGDDLVESIVEKGFLDEYAITVREVTLKGGKKALYIVAGSRRTNAAVLAEPILKKAGKLPKDDPRLFVPVILFDGSDAEALAYRLRENSDPLKRADSASVLSKTFRQLKSFGWTPEQMVEAHGKLPQTEVESLLRFETLPEGTRKAFDAGGIPLSMMIEFLDRIAPEDHPAAIEAAKAAGGAKNPRLARKAAAKAVDPDAVKDAPKVIPKAARRVIAEHLANGRANHLTGQDLIIARSIAAYERFISGTANAIDHLGPIKAIVEAALAPKAKAGKAEEKAS